MVLARCLTWLISMEVRYGQVIIPFLRLIGGAKTNIDKMKFKFVILAISLLVDKTNKRRNYKITKCDFASISFSRELIFSTYTGRKTENRYFILSFVHFVPSKRHKIEQTTWSCPASMYYFLRRLNRAAARTK